MKKCSIETFALVDNGGYKSLIRLRIHDSAYNPIKNVVVGAVQRFCHLNPDDERLYDLGEYEEKAHRLYCEYLDSDDHKLSGNFVFLDDPPEEERSPSSIGRSIKGYFFRIKSKACSFWVFQNLSNSCVTNVKGLKLIGTDSLRLEKGPIFQFGENITFIVHGNIVFFRDIGVLQNSFGFDVLIQSKAKEFLNQLAKSNMIDNTHKVRQYYHKDKMSHGKKFMKVKDSGILKSSMSDLRHRIQNIEVYSSLFDFDSDDRIIIKSYKDVDNLLKLLGDPIVKSVLTDELYNAGIKSKL